LDETDKLFDKIPVIVRFKEEKPVTMKGLEFKIRKHVPIYYGWK